MDLRSGEAFWPIKNGLLGVYPPLDQDLSCEVAVMGGGITGALIAHHLVQAGVDTVVLDRRDVARGSTSASTALLQYEIDTHLYELIEMIGVERARRAYALCYGAIDKLEAIAQSLGDNCTFARKSSLYLASRKRDVPSLEREHQARQAMGIEVEWLNAEGLTERFGINRPAALYSNKAAEVDAYRLTHQLLCKASQSGMRVYDRTEVTDWEQVGQTVRLQTSRGAAVEARHLVIAAGYEAQRFLKQKLALLKNTYAMVSEPLSLPSSLSQTLIWETARPYLYIRTTSDGRVMVGGEDEPFHTLPFRERRIPFKQKRLEKRFAELFPQVTLETAFAWAGTFGETKDGLAYIGQTPEVPGVYFALGYGGNGITYSLVAAEIIRDLCLGRENPDREVFGFQRV